MQEHRRTKRNKYDNFSKVEQIDPLEALLQESERKNGEFLAEQQKKASRKTEIHLKNKARPSQPITEIAPLPQVEFPDTKDIDVSLLNEMKRMTTTVSLKSTHSDFLHNSSISPTIPKPLDTSKLEASWGPTACTGG